MSAPFSVAITPNGKHLFVGSDGGLSVFERDRKTGAVAQLAGEDGCLTWEGENGCKRIPEIGFFVIDVQVSRDGRHVYVSGASHLFVFKLNRTTGRLTLLQALEGRVGRTALSPDDLNLYATAYRAIYVYRRDPKSGLLERLTGDAGCIANARVEGCRRGVISGAVSIAISPDGKHAYLTGDRPGSLTVFERDAETGALRQVRGPSGCLNLTGERGCTAMDEVRVASGLAISPDGKNVYVTSLGAIGIDTVNVFARDEETGTLTRIAGLRGCDSYHGQPDCTPGLGPLIYQIIVSPDGRNAYASGYYALVAFSRSEQ